VTVHISQRIVCGIPEVAINYDPNDPPAICFDTNVWRSINSAKLAELKRLQQMHGFRYRYSVTNFIELASHLEDQPSKSYPEPFRVFQACFRRIIQICDPEILPSPEMVFLTRAGLVHYIDPVWIPDVDQIALKVKLIANANSPAELIGVVNPSHYRYLRDVDGNSMIAIMGKLQKFRRPITRADHPELLEWFKTLAGFFLFVRPTDGKIALQNLPSEEQDRFGMALVGGIGQLFMTHCMKLVQKTINDGRKVDPNDLYDMLQLISLEDDNTLFVTSEKTFFDYQIDPDEPQRMLPWSGFVSFV
jgi:hypothetical protein